MPTDYNPIPDTIKIALDNYIHLKVPTGGFLRALLENNLIATVSKADPVNKPLIPLIVHYCYNLESLPTKAWGSKQAVEAWLGENK